MNVFILKISSRTSNQTKIYLTAYSELWHTVIILLLILELAEPTIMKNLQHQTLESLYKK